MPATEPEQIHGLFQEAFNAGDIEALMALYEPDAALIPQPGVTVEGSAAVRDALRWFLDRHGTITLDTKLVVRVGDLAYLSNRWSLTGGTMPDPNDRTAGIKGGESHDVKPGDFIVIPPGTAHWFSRINGQITYLEIRLPGDVVAAK